VGSDPYGPLLDRSDVQALRGDTQALTASVRSLDRTIANLTEMLRTIFSLPDAREKPEEMRSTLLGIVPR